MSGGKIMFKDYQMPKDFYGVAQLPQIKQKERFK